MATIVLKYNNTFDPTDRIKRQCPELIRYKALGRNETLVNNTEYTLNDELLKRDYATYQNSSSRFTASEDEFITDVVKSLCLSGYFTVVNQQNNTKKESNAKKENGE